MYFHFYIKTTILKQIKYFMIKIAILFKLISYNYYYFSKYRTNIKIKIVFFICVVHNKYATANPRTWQSTQNTGLIVTFLQLYLKLNNLFL